MPRNGSGVYSKPAGTTAVSGTTISSSDYNNTVDDLVADANAARPVVAGGTGAANASDARTNLGLVIGTDVQAYNAALTSIAALGTAANKYIRTTGVDTFAEGDITDAGAALLDDADVAAQRATLEIAATQETKSADYTVVAPDDRTKVFVATANATFTLPSAATAGSGFYFLVFGNGGRITLAPDGSDTANDTDIRDGQWAYVISDGTSDWSVLTANSPEAGAILAHVTFTVSGSTVTVRKSGNVSSVVRNGTGDYTVNFTQQVGTTYPCVTVSATGRPEGAPLSDGGYVAWPSDPGLTSVRIGVADNNVDALRDPDLCCVLVVA